MQTSRRLLPIATLVLTLLCAARLAFAQRLAQSAPTPVQGPCSDDVRALAFLIGDWRSATTDLEAATGAHGNGVNHIEWVLGKCAILQHRRDEKDGRQIFDSYVIWAFDAATNRMREFVVDDGNHAQVYEGIWEDGGWVFYRDRIGTADQMWLARVRYVKSDRGFMQIAELTKDRGKTWTKASTTEYVRQAN